MKYFSKTFPALHLTDFLSFIFPERFGLSSVSPSSAAILNAVMTAQYITHVPRERPRLLCKNVRQYVWFIYLCSAQTIYLKNLKNVWAFNDWIFFRFYVNNALKYKSSWPIQMLLMCGDRTCHSWRKSN